MKIEKIELEEHLSTTHGEEYWMSVTVSYYGIIRTIKRLVLLDRKADSIEDINLLVFIQRYEIEEHLKHIEKNEIKELLDDILF